MPQVLDAVNSCRLYGINEGINLRKSLIIDKAVRKLNLLVCLTYTLFKAFDDLFNYSLAELPAIAQRHPYFRDADPFKVSDTVYSRLKLLLSNC